MEEGEFDRLLPHLRALLPAHGDLETAGAEHNRLLTQAKRVARGPRESTE